MPKRKQVVKRADQVFGVKAVIDCTNISVDKERLFNYLKIRALRCVWADPNTIVEYEEEAADVEGYWAELGKCYGYTLHKNIRLIDYVPNFEKWYNKCQEIANAAREKDDENYYEGKTKPRQSTIYDRVFSTTTCRAD